MPCLHKHPVPPASPYLPSNICLVPVRPPSSGQKEETDLCSLGEKWIVIADGTQRREKTRIIKRKGSYPTYQPNNLCSLFLLSLTRLSQLWWQPCIIKRPASENFIYRPEGGSWAPLRLLLSRSWLPVDHKPFRKEWKALLHFLLWPRFTGY